MQYIAVGAFNISKHLRFDKVRVLPLANSVSDQIAVGAFLLSGVPAYGLSHKFRTPVGLTCLILPEHKPYRTCSNRKAGHNPRHISELCFFKKLIFAVRVFQILHYKHIELHYYKL